MGFYLVCVRAWGALACGGLGQLCDSWLPNACQCGVGTWEPEENIKSQPAWQLPVMLLMLYLPGLCLQAARQLLLPSGCWQPLVKQVCSMHLTRVVGQACLHHSCFEWLCGLLGSDLLAWQSQHGGLVGSSDCPAGMCCMLHASEVLCNITWHGMMASWARVRSTARLLFLWVAS